MCRLGAGVLVSFAVFGMVISSPLRGVGVGNAGVLSGEGVVGGGVVVTPLRLDLNRATAAELSSLPGIGETLAGRVVEVRERRGGFRRVEDLRDVRGIGEKTVERVRGLVVVGGAAAGGRD